MATFIVTGGMLNVEPAPAAPVDPGYGKPPPTWGGQPPPGYITGGQPPPGYITGGPGWLPQPQPPLGFWGPPGPWVTPPIANVPGAPGYQPPGGGGGSPPGFWGPPGPWPTPPIANVPGAPGYDPRPSHPIALPPPGAIQPPDPPTEPPTNPADPNWQWVFVPMGDGSGRWVPAYVPGPSDPQPH